jgi:hypothetical protein
VQEKLCPARGYLNMPVLMPLLGDCTCWWPVNGEQGRVDLNARRWLAQPLDF